MVPTRRRLLRAAGTASFAVFAGCSTAGLGGSAHDSTEYALRVDSIDASPTARALYEPDAHDAPFGAPARTALDATLPDGRYTTYGYEPLPTDAYVEREGTYYQTKRVVTGRRRLSRSLVGVDTVPRAQVPEDALVVDALDRASARVIPRGRRRSPTAPDGFTTWAPAPDSARVSGRGRRRRSRRRRG